jgi:hypothetical protein
MYNTENEVCTEKAQLN